MVQGRYFSRKIVQCKRRDHEEKNNLKEKRLGRKNKEQDSAEIYCRQK